MRTERESPPEPSEPRRHFLTTTGITMTAGVAAGYGTLAAMFGQFVFPAGGDNRGWLFVCQTETIAPGSAIEFTTPAGAKIVIARQAKSANQQDSTAAGAIAAEVTEAEFLALSSVCPHLGCRVHWEGAQERFFCPCHNGAFDRQGNATEGPPLAASQSLVRFPLKVERGLLFLEASLSAVIG